MREANSKAVDLQQPLREVVSRLDAIVAALHAPPREPSLSSAAIPDTVPERAVDESMTVAVLREILEELSARPSS